MARWLWLRWVFANIRLGGFKFSSWMKKLVKTNLDGPFVYHMDAMNLLLMVQKSGKLTS